jgi:hypothetical protein
MEDSMKALFRKVVLIVLCISFPTFLYGADSTKTNKVSTYENIEKNLLVGLNSDNEGLKFSCAYYLGEIKSSKAVIPLLRLFHNGSTDEMKIIAALSLCKINSDRGVFAVKRAIKFADSERVRRTCNLFYHSHMKSQQSEVEVEPIQLAFDLTSAFNGYTLSDFK